MFSLARNAPKGLEPYLAIVIGYCYKIWNVKTVYNSCMIDTGDLLQFTSTLL